MTEFKTKEDFAPHMAGLSRINPAAPIEVKQAWFIYRSKLAHGNRYDYSKARYKSATKKVTIICPVHGEFEQAPASHAKGIGCSKCKADLLSKHFRSTTEDFVRKARKVHGDRFDYSLVNYKNSRIKVTIICPDHGDFEQKPSDHLTGYGCARCAGMNKTTKEVIAEFREVHGDKYDYSRVIYTKAIKKVVITCPVHGDFEQKPSDHLSGKGCPKCAEKNKGSSQRLTKLSFTEKARAVHGDKYDYSRVIYRNSTEKVVFTCPIHGDFEQTARGHLTGRGCYKCGRDLSGNKFRHSKQDFIVRSREAHGDKYDYSKVEYKTNSSKVTIVCSVHGDFEQRPSDHLNGKGCPKCAGKCYTTEDFTQKARAVHGDRFDYSKTVYESAKTKVMITCPDHGDFEQTPDAHLSGQGCPKCAKSGYNTEKTGFLYVLASECGSMMKVGITNFPEQRFNQLTRATPFCFQRLELFKYEDGAIPPYLEAFAKKHCQSANLIGFDGATEWFKFDGRVIEQLRQYHHLESATA